MQLYWTLTTPSSLNTRISGWKVMRERSSANLSSKIGSMFITQRLTVRSEKVSVPEPLEPSGLICWKHKATPKSPMADYEGIPWGYEQIFDIFEILSQVVDAEEFSDGTKWFTFDKDELKRVKLQAAKARESSVVRYSSNTYNWKLAHD